MIHQTIKDELKKAMLAKEETRVLVLRGLLAGFVSELVAQKKMPNEMIADLDATRVVMRQVKQRKDSISQFEAGGRSELAESEKKELAILETFLPKMMSEEEIRTAVSAKLKEVGGKPDNASVGKLIGIMMKEFNGKADGTVVKKVIDEILS